MKENIVVKLTAKDDKSACAFADKIISESQETDEWYQYFDDFASLLDHPKSLVRNRALYILAANAQWDVGWQEIINAVRKSDSLLKDTWNKNAEAVAKGIEEAHFETSILKYNDENSLACVVSLVFYSARAYYTEIRELPAGQGFADIVYLPRKNHQDKPTMIVELKWDKSAEGAIEQIKKKKYVKALEDYQGNLLLVGVNYSKDSKAHQCVIEEVSEW